MSSSRTGRSTIRHDGRDLAETPQEEVPTGISSGERIERFSDHLRNIRHLAAEQDPFDWQSGPGPIRGRRRAHASAGLLSILDPPDHVSCHHALDMFRSQQAQPIR